MKNKKYLYAVESFKWRKTENGNWEEYEYPAGTKVEVIGSSPRGYDVKICETGVKMCETGMMKWSQTPLDTTKPLFNNPITPTDMTTEERNAKILEALEMANKIKYMLNNIVWEKQEGQEKHFDKLPKVQQIAIAGLLNHAVDLSSALSNYKHWFINE